MVFVGMLHQLFTDATFPSAGCVIAHQCKRMNSPPPPCSLVVPVFCTCRRGAPNQEPVASRGRRLAFTSNWMIGQEQDPCSLGSSSQMMFSAHCDTRAQTGTDVALHDSPRRGGAGAHGPLLQHPFEQVSLTFVAK